MIVTDVLKVSYAIFSISTALKLVNLYRLYMNYAKNTMMWETQQRYSAKTYTRSWISAQDNERKVSYD